MKSHNRRQQTAMSQTDRIVQRLGTLCDPATRTTFTNGPGPDEIATNVYVGNIQNAKSTTTLKTLGITHVLNCAPGVVRTSKEYYHKRGLPCVYQQVHAKDSSDEPILDKFLPVVVKMVQHVDQEPTHHKLFIHCYAGCNRSVALIVAALMLVRKQGLINVVARVLHVRPQVLSNGNFKRQLAELAVQHALVETKKEPTPHSGAENTPLNLNKTETTGYTLQAHRNPFDVHVYFQNDNEYKASMVLQEELLHRFPWMRVMPAHFTPIGPHSCPMWEADFAHEENANKVEEVVAFLEAQHGGLSVLVHPHSEDGHVADHTTHARWVGARLPLLLSKGK